jgi:hypothetical protein
VFVNATGNELNYDRGTGERVGLLLLVMVGLFIVVRARRVESVQDEVVDVLLDRLVPSLRTAEKPNRPVSNAAGDLDLVDTGLTRREAFERFATEQIGAHTHEVGFRGSPSISFDEVHTCFTAGA